MKNNKLFIQLFLILLFLLSFVFCLQSSVLAQSTVNWYMAGANPQRTSWVAEQVPANGGTLYPQWFKLIEPKVSNNFQIVAGNDMIFLSTARGLYAFDTDGNIKWVYPTEMPLGHSATYIETSFSTYPKRLYLPGLDHKIHCIDASPDVNSLPSVTIPDSNNTIQKINNHVCWTYEAKTDGIGAGFQTNPLVLNIGGSINIYAGNRDGYMYALKDNGTTVSQLWNPYKTDGPILFSAAASYPNANGLYDVNTKIYFASQDSYAYALNASTGGFAWKSAKLPGSGFSAFWPVVYKHTDGKEYVLLAGSHNYREGVPPGIPTGGFYLNSENIEREIFLGDGIYKQGNTPEGTLIGTLSNGWVDTSIKASGAAMSMTSYFQNKPWRKTYFVLDDMGHESTGYAPFGWVGSQSGNRYPSIIMPDNNIYQTALYSYSNEFINLGAVLKWRFGTPLVAKGIQHHLAVDEPLYIAAGGNMIYFNWWGGFVLGASNTATGSEQILYDHNQCGGYQWPFTPHCLFPGYDAAQDGIGGRAALSYQNGPFGTAGSYDRDGNGNPPIPYKGKLYWVDANAILVLGSTSKSLGTKTTTAWTVEKQDFPNYVTQFSPNVGDTVLKQKLETEVLKMIAAGHLYPGYYSSGMIDGDVQQANGGDSLHDYFHTSADTLWTLGAAMPYLSTSTQNSLKTYLTNQEYIPYDPTRYFHMGFATGSSRSWFDLPPEVEQDRSRITANFSELFTYNYGFPGWGSGKGGTGIPPYVTYALWLYAKAEGMSATEVKNNILPKATTVLDTSLPVDSVLTLYPFVHNAYLTSLYGYMQLEKMAGNITDITQSTHYSQYTSELTHRATLFDRNVPAGDYPSFYDWAYNGSRNFMFLAREVAQDLAKNATYLNKVQVALNGLRVPAVFSRDFAYWFVPGFDDATYESVHQPMYDQTLFQAKANILGDKKEELLKYLDVPYFKVGDLFYIQNLVTLIEAQSSGPIPTASPVSSATPNPTPTTDPCPKKSQGDLNCDQTVNLTDLIFGLGKYILNDPADVNGDGKMNMLDLAVIIKTLMPVIPSSTPPTISPSPTPMPSATPSSGGLNSGLVDYWKMDETSGDVIGAYAGKNFTVTGSVTNASGKVYSTARLFPGPGVAGVATRTNSDVKFADSDVTFSFWWYQNTTPNGASPQLYHYLWQQDSYDGGYTIGLNGANEVFIQSAYGNGGVDTLHSNTLTNPNGIWHFAIVWYNSGDKSLHIKVDNGSEQVLTGVHVHTMGSNPARIGSDSSNNNVMDGRIGPIAVWNRILNTTEMTQLWNNGNGFQF